MKEALVAVQRQCREALAASVLAGEERTKEGRAAARSQQEELRALAAEAAAEAVAALGTSLSSDLAAREVTATRARDLLRSPLSARLRSYSQVRACPFLSYSRSPPGLDFRNCTSKGRASG